MASPASGWTVRLNGPPTAGAPTASTSHYHPYAKGQQQQQQQPKAVLFINSQPSPARIGSGSFKSTEAGVGSSESSSAQAHQLHRPKRKKITDDQLEHLIALFSLTDSPTYDQREEVGQRVKPTMTSREVQVWFQNRRAKVNREKQQNNQQLGTDDHPPALKAELGGTKSQFRFKPTAAAEAQLGPSAQVKPQPNEQTISSFRIPNPNQLNPAPGPATVDRFNRSPVLAQSQAGPHRRAFTGPPIQIPARHPPHPHLVHHHSHTGAVNADSPRSPSAYSSSPSVVGSPFFGVHSPTFAFTHSNSAQSVYQAMPAGGTPGLSSHSSSGSGYFGAAAASGGSAFSGSEWPPASPYTPGSLYSPSTNFFKLSLSDSPRDAKWEQGAPLGSPGLPLSPPPTAGERVKLPPITSSPRRWRSSKASANDDSVQRGLTHKRSFSDGTSNPTPFSRGHRLPSLRGLFEGLTRKVHHPNSAQRTGASTSTTSAPTSPVRAGPVLSSQQASPRKIVRSVTTPQLGQGCDQNAEEDQMEMDGPEHTMPLGLGMLAVAADSLRKLNDRAEASNKKGDSDEEREREKLWRLRATRKLSYDCGLGHPSTAAATRRRSREQVSSDEDSGNSSGMETAR